MKTSTRVRLLATCAAAATALLSACGKDDTPPADPAPYFELGNRTIRPNGSAYVIDANPSSIQGAAALGPKALALDFVNSAAKLHLELDRNQLKLRDSPLRGADWVGSYAWRSFDRPTDPVLVRYEFRWEGTTSVFPFSETTPQLTGDLTITAYDANRQLISGRYELNAPNQLNPLPSSIAMFPLVTIRVYGKFDNLKVKM